MKNIETFAVFALATVFQLPFHVLLGLPGFLGRG